MSDLKTFAISLGGFSVTLTGIEQWLKITLLICSVAYTIMRIIKMNKSDKTED